MRFFFFQILIISRAFKGSGNYKDLDKTQVKLFPNFTRHHMITNTELNFNIIVDHKNGKQNKNKKRVSAGEFVYNRNRGRWLFIQSPLQKWGEHQTYSWGHVKHDYLIKYACFVKCYLERFASISDPEKRTTNVAQQTNKQTNKQKNVKLDFK